MSPRRGHQKAHGPLPPAFLLAPHPPRDRAAFGRLLARLAPYLAHRPAADLAALGAAICELSAPTSEAETDARIRQHLDPQQFRRWLHQPTHQESPDVRHRDSP